MHAEFGLFAPTPSATPKTLYWVAVLLVAGRCWRYWTSQQTSHIG